MTNPGDAIDNPPNIQITAVTTHLRAMLRVLEAFGLGELSVTELLEQVDRLAWELTCSG